ncbi:MAG: hypothetical protein MZV64_64565 [Ignavibacteriales bacterium]|nr:hypothetical protein [Ignavibacteriales bacterium]
MPSSARVSSTKIMSPWFQDLPVTGTWKLSEYLGAEDVEQLALLGLDGRSRTQSDVSGRKSSRMSRSSGFNSAPRVDRLHVLRDDIGNLGIDPAERSDDAPRVGIRTLIPSREREIGSSSRPGSGTQARKSRCIMTGGLT